jgi:subfamily B ATP-binding cassette protein HlyB/CyaB
MVDVVSPHTPPQPAAETDSAWLSLALIAQVHGLVVDPAQARHAAGLSGEAPSARDIIRAARDLGFKARETSVRWSRLQKTPLPAIAVLGDGRFRVLAAAKADAVLLHDPVAGRAESLSEAAFAEIWSGRLILLAPRAAAPEEVTRFGFAWFATAAGKYRVLLAEVLVASLVLQLFALISPMMFQVVIDKVLVHRGLTTLDVVVIGLLAVSVFEVLLTILRSYLSSHTTTRLDVELGTRLFRRLLGLPMSYFESRRVGDTVARLKELDSVRNFLTGSGLTFMIDGAFAIVFLVVMHMYSPMLAWVVIATIPLYILISAVVTPLLKQRLDERSARGAETQVFAVEAIGGIETLKAMAIEPRVQRRFEEQLAASTRSSFGAVNVNTIASNLVSLVSKLSTVVLLWLGARFVIEGSLSVGQLIAFNMLAGRVTQPILRISQLWQELQQTRVSITRLADIMDARPEAPMASRSNPPRIEGRIELDHVSFRYRQDGPEVLSDIVLEIRPGEVLGVTGPSGSGKSTLAKLIQRLHVPERGRVLVDGLDLAQIDPAWLRRQIGVVLQENVLFHRSVRENIALADPSLPMEQVMAAAELAGAHEFILGLPKGYDTLVGERGSNLSGGQRQRIALARALIVDPRILILDEATSALDYESERVIQDNMRRICAGRTVIVIAHRLSTIRFADRIVTIEKGRLIEQGRHEELILTGGRYAQLHRIQLGERAGD